MTKIGKKIMSSKGVSPLKNEGIVKKNYYEGRNYELVDERSLSSEIRRKK